MAKPAKLGMFQSDPDGLAAPEGCPASNLAAGFQPFSDSYLADPYPFFERARREEPVFYSPETGYWVVARHADIVAVFRDPKTFSAALARHPVTPLCPEAARVRDGLDIAIEPSLVDEDP
ncbi:MAG: hypothetical protein OXP07_15115, partial [Defluviicoccus sp.]|nr:hypothetical protein [Defluviicoccus sp.]